MSGRLEGRVSRLEDGHREPCEECGFDGNRGSVDIEWYDGEKDTGPEKTTYCESCGEPTEIIITWDDIPPYEDIKEEA